MLLQGRYSFVGAQPALEVVAKGQSVTVLDHVHGARSVREEADPMQVHSSSAKSSNYTAGFTPGRPQRQRHCCCHHAFRVFVA